MKVIPPTKKSGKELLKEASPEHKLRVCAYSLLSDIHQYKMVALPNYELIIVKCKRETTKDDFRKLIPTIVQKEKRFVEFLATKKNGQIVSFKYSIIKEVWALLFH